MKETKITSKFQTTIPSDIRKFLDVKPGKELEWCVIKGMVVVDVARKIERPVEFLTSQIKLNEDAVKLVREARNDFK
jgi:AbrB family looped-hinge helix DNA binding protein